ncbi:MAG: helix-turn-helix domain-containing protein [Flavobacteriales bacterium]
MIEGTVKKYCKQRGLTLKELAEQVGMTETGFSRALKKKSLKVKTLERISEVLQVPIASLFGEEEKLEEERPDYPVWQEGVEKRLQLLEEEIRKIRRSVS